jgi:hypothetical protein
MRQKTSFTPVGTASGHVFAETVASDASGMFDLRPGDYYITNTTVQYASESGILADGQPGNDPVLRVWDSLFSFNGNSHNTADLRAFLGGKTVSDSVR